MPPRFSKGACLSILEGILYGTRVTQRFAAHVLKIISSVAVRRSEVKLISISVGSSRCSARRRRYAVGNRSLRIIDDISSSPLRADCATRAHPHNSPKSRRVLRSVPPLRVCGRATRVPTSLRGGIVFKTV